MQPLLYPPTFSNNIIRIIWVKYILTLSPVYGAQKVITLTITVFTRMSTRGILCFFPLLTHFNVEILSLSENPSKIPLFTK